MLLKGFKFGMLLQLAVGPVCIFIFRTGSARGLVTAETGVLAVALVDALFIVLAILGIAAFIEKERFRKAFTLIGAVVVAGFGLQILAETMGFKILPTLALFHGLTSSNAFWEGLLLTASNPLTILFWAGVFSAKIAEERMMRQDIYRFGAGAVGSTLCFLTAIAILGGVTRQFLPVIVITWLNLVVGLVLIGFALKMVLQRSN
jgi:threonine/homoserine/homoserine lactone efflux protein